MAVNCFHFQTLDSFAAQAAFLTNAFVRASCYLDTEQMFFIHTLIITNNVVGAHLTVSMSISVTV